MPGALERFARAIAGPASIATHAARACQGGFVKKARRNGKAAPGLVDRPACGEYTGFEAARTCLLYTSITNGISTLIPA